MTGFADVSSMEMEMVGGGFNGLQVLLGITEVVGAAYVATQTAGIGTFVAYGLVTAGAADIASGIWGK